MSMLSCMKQPVILTLHEWLEIPFSFKLGWSMWMGRGASSSYLLALTHPVDHPSSCHPNKCFFSKWTYPSKLHLLQWSDLLMFAQGRESECSCTAGLPKRHWEDSRAGFWDWVISLSSSANCWLGWGLPWAGDANCASTFHMLTCLCSIVGPVKRKMGFLCVKLQLGIWGKEC